MSVYQASSVKRYRRTNAELDRIDDAIIAAVEADYPVTLRGVYYRVVSMGAIAKTEQAYNVVGRQLLKLRRSGAVPYGKITDGTRFLRRLQTWDSLDQMLENAASSYRRALWAQQHDEVMIFTEKDAISGVLMPVVDRWDVPLGVLRGYSSESFAHTVALHIIASNNARDGDTYVYQLGDHDPSGVDAWRDFSAKVQAFIEAEYDYADFVRFERLAVTEQQIIDMQLPTRPTKEKDTRAAEFRGESVEVDAIPASTLRALVDGAITQHIEQAQLRVDQIAQQSEREVLLAMRAGRGPRS